MVWQLAFHSVTASAATLAHGHLEHERRLAFGHLGPFALRGCNLVRRQPKVVNRVKIRAYVGRQAVAHILFGGGDKELVGVDELLVRLGAARLLFALFKVDELAHHILRVREQVIQLLVLPTVFCERVRFASTSSRLTSSSTHRAPRFSLRGSSDAFTFL